MTATSLASAATVALSAQGKDCAAFKARLDRGGFVSVPTVFMTDWLSKTLHDLECVFETERGNMRLKLLRYTKQCGHDGHLMELYLKAPDGEELTVGFIGWESLGDVADMMHDAGAFLAKKAG